MTGGQQVDARIDAVLHLRPQGGIARQFRNQTGQDRGRDDPVRPLSIDADPGAALLEGFKSVLQFAFRIADMG